MLCYISCADKIACPRIYIGVISFLIYLHFVVLRPLQFTQVFCNSDSANIFRTMNKLFKEFGMAYLFSTKQCIVYICAIALSACGGGSSETPVAQNPTPAPIPPPTNTLTLQNGPTQIVCDGKTFPTQGIWGENGNAASGQPQAATSGTPKIEQYRAGKLVATYSHFGTSGSYSAANTFPGADPTGGAFSRVPYRQFADGDEYRVYPAVYEGETQQPWIGPMVASYLGLTEIPKNITIRGMTVNGVRPVIRLPATGAPNNTLGQGMIYFDQSENIIFDNFDIESTTSSGSVGKAAIYVNGAKNLTLRNLRIHGFKAQDANGIFGTDNNSGTLRMEYIELFDNGGGNGPEHNIYIGASKLDPNFTVHMTGSYSHSAFYGHLYKSRAQKNILEGNYFRGTLGSAQQAENYLVDVPNGGVLTMRNNVLVKNASGDNSNGLMVTFKMEGASDTRSDAITIEHNTFVAYSRYYDSQQHQLAPYSFFYPPKNPAAADFPVANIKVRGNAYVGLCHHYGIELNYRGTDYVEGWFDLLNSDFSLKGIGQVAQSSATQSPSYSFPLGVGVRVGNQAGARD
jgi:hypothetical protein